MAEGIVPNEGLARGLKWLIDNPDTQLFAWELVLFVNDLTPGAGTVFADLVEPSWGGYARFPLTPADWGEPIVAEDAARSTWGLNPVEFVNVAGPTQTVFGVGYYDPAFGVLRYCQRFDPGDIRPVAAGESVVIVPQFSRLGAPC